MDEEKADDCGRSSEQEGNKVKFSFTASRPKFSASRPPRFPKSKQRSATAEENRVAEFVHAFNEQRLAATHHKGVRRARGLPNWENSWRPEKRMKSIMVETDVSERLMGRSSPATLRGIAFGVKESDDNVAKEHHLHRIGGTSREEGENPKLPFNGLDDRNVQEGFVSFRNKDSFVEMPIDDFREAFLRGMGWETLAPIGLDCSGGYLVKKKTWTNLEAKANSKVGTNIRQLKRCESGLVASELLSFIRQGATQDLVAVDDKEGDGSLKGVIKGKVMSIISGQHLGLRGEVLDSEKSGTVAIMLVQSGQRVLVSVKDLADVGSLEEEKVLKQIRELRIGNCEPSQEDESNVGSSTLDADEVVFHGKEELNHEKRETTISPDFDKLKPEYRSEGDVSRSLTGDCRRHGRVSNENEKRPTEGSLSVKTPDEKGVHMDVEDGRRARTEYSRSLIGLQMREDIGADVRESMLDFGNEGLAQKEVTKLN